MTQNQAINVVGRLVGAINASGDPAAVLIKEARDSSLAPAQLEKLGAVYNTIRTQQHFAKAGSARGSSFPILDVPSMVKNYSLEDRRFRESGAEFLDKAASDAQERPIRNGGMFPQVKVNQEQPMLKAARTEHGTFWSPDAQRRCEYLDRTLAQRIERLEQQIYEIDPKIVKQASAIFDKLKAAGPKAYAQCIEDTWALAPETEPAVEILDAFRKFAGIQPWNGISTRKLVDDRHGLIPAITKLAADVVSCREWSAQLETHRRDLMDLRAATASFLRKEGQAWKKSPPAPTKKPLEKKLDSLANPVESFANAVASYEPTPPAIIAQQSARTVAEAPSAQMDAVNMSSLPRELAVTQNAFDDEVLASRRLANFQRILIQDPIIAKADPVEALDVYNNLLTLDPAIGDKPMVLTSVMRAAVQQQGLDPHDLKTMLDIEKLNLETNLKAEQDKARTRYPVYPGRSAAKPPEKGGKK